MALTYTTEGHMLIESKDVSSLSLEELRRHWAKAWGIWPHARIGRAMLETSLIYKKHEQNGQGLTQSQQKHLQQLIKEYKRSPKTSLNRQTLKPGTKLVRCYKGKKYSVIVKPDGYEYNGQLYGSLSKIANNITGTRWNGKLFFGLK